MSALHKICRSTLATATTCVVVIANIHGQEVPQALVNLIDTHCIDCHSSDEAVAELSLEDFEKVYLSPFLSGLDSNECDTEKLELILRRIKSRQMPPPEYDSDPEDGGCDVAVNDLESFLAGVAQRHPKVGNVSAIRRLTRTEYRNAIRDLLGVRVSVNDLLPKDESSHGFDNITVETLSPTLINRYVSAAEKISAAAVGASRDLASVTVRIPADRTQEQHVAGLPFGTRGGIAIEHQFHQSGDYEIEIKLTRDRDEKVEGLNHEHRLDVLIDRARVHRFTVKPPPVPESGGWESRDFTHSDSHLKARFHVEAGAHQVAVTFPNKFSSLEESKRQPFDASFNRHRHPRKTPAIFQVSIVGPFSPAGPGNTVSRRLIFGDVDLSNVESLTTEDLRVKAKRILTNLARRAYRRSVNEDDVEPLLYFFDNVVMSSSANPRDRERDSMRAQFDSGIQAAVASVLVNPNFLLHVESQPDEMRQGQPYLISDFELASRLARFLWSSIPDETLLDLAQQNQLQKPAKLRQQVRRMLSDPKADSLVTNFADQWLHLRNLESITPDLRLFPDFDDNLRQSFRGETQGLFADIMRNDLSVLQLIDSDYTFLNQRLATHYGIAKVQGSHFRKVSLSSVDAAENIRGGILRHGSILMVTSYATRTSPTIRGNWVLENIMGTPAPPPPPNVPNLKENTPLEAKSVRQRLAQHRKDPACASCHNLMDPVGFSLENFDVVGRWRDYEDGIPVDSTGRLPDGKQIHQLDDLEQGILERPEMFVTAMVEKMMTFAIGRGIEPFDGPEVRKIVENAMKKDFRFSSLVMGIVESKPFRMRSAQ